MIKKIIFLTIIVLVLAFFGLKLVGFFDNNQIKFTIGTDDKDELDVGVSTEKVEKENGNVEDKVEVKSECTDNSECEGMKCIDGKCKEVVELYETENCEAKCNFKTAKIETSDGDTLTIKRGESTYTAAGALAWKLLSGPDYCEGSEVVVPIEVTKMNLGKELGKDVVTVKVGEKSSAITHPTIERIQFTVDVKEISEECS